MGAACDHIEHVKTQLPYAIMVGVVTFAGYMLSYWVNSPIVLALSAVVGVCAITLIFSKIHGVNVSGKI